jgi:hypothetical protein
MFFKKKIEFGIFLDDTPISKNMTFQNDFFKSIFHKAQAPSFCMGA